MELEVYFVSGQGEFAVEYFVYCDSVYYDQNGRYAPDVEIMDFYGAQREELLSLLGGNLDG